MSTHKRLGTTQLLFASAQQMGLQPAWILANRLFAVQTDAGEQYVQGPRSAANSHVSSCLAGNKLLTRLILARHKLPNIPFLRAEDQAEAQQFLATHAKIIVKPLHGSNSRDVHIVESPEQMAAMDIHQYILEKYIAGKEMRYLVVNNKIIGVHHSAYGVSVSPTRDLQRISFPEIEWDPALVALSLRVADIFDLRYAAVDYLVDASGTAHILEVNSSPGMHLFHTPTTGPEVDVARHFLQAMLTGVR